MVHGYFHTDDGGLHLRFKGSVLTLMRLFYGWLCYTPCVGSKKIKGDIYECYGDRVI